MEYQIEPEDKSTTVMVYTTNMLVRGELITKKIMRVGIWPRSMGVPNLLHLFNPNVLLFGGPAPKHFSQAEIFIPTANLIGFHPATFLDEPLDYDPNEKNRSTASVSLIMGGFIVKGQIRIASTSNLSTSLEVMYNGWLSVYDAEITNSFLPQTQPMLVKFLLVKPNQTSFFV